MSLVKPKQLNQSNWRREYYLKDVNKFFDSINIAKGDISGKSLFIEDKTISQSKLREAGFSIKRDKSKSDLIVIKDMRKEKEFTIDVALKSGKEVCIFAGYGYGGNLPENILFDRLIAEESLGYTYIFVHDLYKYLYKYEGNYELFNNLDDLCASKDKNNVKIAMEMLANANWGDNEIYLQELFNKHWHTMSHNSYRQSISFKGLLSALSFDPNEYRFLDNAQDYKPLCKTQEHHDFVYNKFKGEFESELKDLFTRYKIKIDELKYSIAT